jgi:hypothetical protein
MEFMKTLEINVNDSIFVADNLVQAQEIIMKAIEKWYLSDDKKPLIITLNKIEDRGPPVLEISVGDIITTKGGLV